MPFLFHSNNILSMYLKLLTPLNTASLSAAKIRSLDILDSSQLFIISYSIGDNVLPNSFSNSEYKLESLTLSFSSSKNLENTIS